MTKLRFTVSMESIVVVRHGETEINRANKETKDRMIGGQLESPLLPEGMDGAIEAGKKISGMSGIDIRLAVSSDLSRAVDTRDLIVEQLSGKKEIRSHKTAGLREIDYGKFAGKRESQAAQEFPEYFSGPTFKNWRGDFDHKAPGGENYADIAARLGDLDSLLRQTDGDVLIVSHMHTIRVLLHRALGLTPEQTIRLKIPNTIPLVLKRDKMVGEVTLAHLLS